MRTLFYTLTGTGPISARVFEAKLTPESGKHFSAGLPLPCAGNSHAEAALMLGRTCRQILGESVTLKLVDSYSFKEIKCPCCG